jgi:hypothetical protein
MTPDRKMNDCLGCDKRFPADYDYCPHCGEGLQTQVPKSGPTRKELEALPAGFHRDFGLLALDMAEAELKAMLAPSPFFKKIVRPQSLTIRPSDA